MTTEAHRPSEERGDPPFPADEAKTCPYCCGEGVLVSPTDATEECRVCDGLGVVRKEGTEQLAKREVRHAEGFSGDDRTLCGFAYEDLLNGEEINLLAAPGGHVTCADCKRLIAYCQDRFTGNYKVRRNG